MRTFGLIGHPLTHSFSKKYFTEKFEKEKIDDCRFELFDLKDIDELDDLLSRETALKGLSVTIPYKRQVVGRLHRSNLPAGIGACNCIRIDGDRLTGYNTDVVGFEKSFSPLLRPDHHSALVLGHGGATEAVVFVLKKLGLDYRIASRNSTGREFIRYDQIDASMIGSSPVIINTTPLGTFPDTAHCAPIPYQAIGAGHYLFDLVYNPAKTLFLQKGEEQGALIKNGYDMLVFQAEESWKIWNQTSA